MSDLFSAYGAEKTRERKQPAYIETKAPSPLEQKMREKQRLGKAFRKWRRSENQATLKSEPRLRDFLKYLRTIDATNGGELIEALDACQWIRTASLNVRIFALRMIGARCDKINQQLGNEALDDPIPPDTNIYFQSRSLLHAGGRA